MPAADVGHIVAALHFDAWLGDIRGGRVYWLLEHALVDSGFPGADVAGAALQARLKSPLNILVKLILILCTLD